MIRRRIIQIAVKLVPAGRFFELKAHMWRLAGFDISKDARLMSSVFIATSGNLYIGKDTFIGHEVMLTGGAADIHIGSQCDIAPRVVVITGSHEFGAPGERVAGPSFSKPIHIGDRVWIGVNATILGGVTIGDGAFIAAGSVVVANVPAGARVAGIPARIFN
jgi:maltose O-acetyltransferase